MAKERALGPFDRRAVLEDARRLVQQNKIPLAIEAYEQVVHHDPDDWTSRNALGDLLVKARLVDQASDEFIRAAEVLVKAGFLARAAGFYKKVLRLDPGHAEALRRADALQALRFEKSEEDELSARVLKAARSGPSTTADTSPLESSSQVSAAGVPHDVASTESVLSIPSATVEVPADPDIVGHIGTPDIPTHIPLTPGYSDDQAPNEVHSTTSEWTAIETAENGEQDLTDWLNSSEPAPAQNGGDWAAAHDDGAGYDWVSPAEEPDEYAGEALSPTPPAPADRDITARLDQWDGAADPDGAAGDVESILAELRTLLSSTEDESPAGLELSPVADDLIDPDIDPAADPALTVTSWDTDLIGRDPDEAFLAWRDQWLEVAAIAAESSLERGIKLAENGRWPEASTLFAEAALAPHLRHEAARCAAHARLNLGLPQQAVAWLEWAAQVPAPTTPSARALAYDLGVALEAAGQPGPSLAVLQALQSDVGSGYQDVDTRITRLAGWR